MIQHPTAFLSFLLQPVQQGPSRPARVQGSVCRAPPTAAPPPKPRRSAHAAMATTGRTLTHRQLPAPVSNRSGLVGGGCRVLHSSAARDNISTQELFRLLFSPCPAVGGSKTVAGWAFGCHPWSIHCEGLDLQRAGVPIVSTHPFPHCTHRLHVL